MWKFQPWCWRVVRWDLWRFMEKTDSLSKIDTPKLPESVLLNQSLSEYVAFHDFALESHIYIFKKATCNHYCIEYTVYHYYTLSICIVQSTCLGRTELWISYSAAERKKTSRQPWSWLVGFPKLPWFPDETWWNMVFPWFSMNFLSQWLKYAPETTTHETCRYAIRTRFGTEYLSDTISVGASPQNSLCSCVRVAATSFSAKQFYILWGVSRAWQPLPKFGKIIR